MTGFEPRTSGLEAIVSQLSHNHCPQKKLNICHRELTLREGLAATAMCQSQLREHSFSVHTKPSMLWIKQRSLHT